VKSPRDESQLYGSSSERIQELRTNPQTNELEPLRKLYLPGDHRPLPEKRRPDDSI